MILQKTDSEAQIARFKFKAKTKEQQQQKTSYCHIT